MKFNVYKDLDVERLKALAFEEAAGIHSHPSRARGRSLREIKEVTIMGKAAELYLMDVHGYAKDPAYCKDVIDPNGVPVEIKTTSQWSYIPFVLRRAAKAARKEFRKHQEVLYIFVVNVYSGDYELAGIYNWNGKEFVK